MKKTRRTSWREKPIIVVLIVLGIVVFTFISLFSTSNRIDPQEEIYIADVTPTPTPEQKPEPKPELTPEPTPEQTPIAQAEEILPPPVETPEPTPDPGIDYLLEGGQFELPLTGATGYAPVPLRLYAEPGTNAGSIMTLSAGKGFTILSEDAGWWNITADGFEGWVSHRFCFINLPDLLPSIVYNITNAGSSVMRSSGYEIPNITTHKLYEAKSFNPRLNREEYVVPVLYSTAKLIFNAQQAALSDGNTIIMVEAFRPRETQQLIVRNLQSLMNSNSEVRNAINAPPWGISWFISTSLSNHQRGAAVDVSLGKIITLEAGKTGNYAYKQITEYEEYTMPTAMHELGPRAATFKNPVSSTSRTDWKQAAFSDSITDAAKLMQSYFTNAGFTPLASEWWHFNDLDGRGRASEAGITGDFIIGIVHSVEPY